MFTDTVSSKAIDGSLIREEEKLGNKDGCAGQGRAGGIPCGFSLFPLQQATEVL